MNPDITTLLEPLRPPEPVGWWPLAPGWWILLTLVLLASGFGLYQLWRYYQRGAVLREARSSLRKLAQMTGDPQRCACEVNTLQRRLCLAFAPRRDAAGLTGPAWADLLNGLTRDNSAPLDPDLLRLAYQPTISEDQIAALVAQTTRWLDRLGRPS